jgi:hypothetical protein
LASKLGNSEARQGFADRLRLAAKHSGRTGCQRWVAANGLTIVIH